jgi:hypothetical protein
MSIFKPEGSVVAGAAVAALVYATYSQSVPNASVVHATQAHDTNIESGRKKAAWTSAAVVGGVSLIARDPTIFVLGGLVLIALDFHARHANATDPATGDLVSTQGYQPAHSPVQLTEAA